jgi:hypothetical protein
MISMFHKFHNSCQKRSELTYSTFPRLLLLLLLAPDSRVVASEEDNIMMVTLHATLWYRTMRRRYKVEKRFNLVLSGGRKAMMGFSLRKH